MTRDDLAQLATGIGAELGVAAGQYSDTLLTVGHLERLYSIDRWTDHHDEAEYRKACALLSRHGDRSVIVRATFADAVAMFPEDYFSFVFIDGYAHTGQEGGRTLSDWWPKVRPGGIFAGHDYAPQYPLTVQAVDAFAAAHGLTVQLTDEPLPSWFCVKS